MPEDTTKKPWYRRKTNIAAVTLIAGAAITFGFGGMGLKEFLTAIIGGLITIFMRQGIAKTPGE